MKIKRKNLGFQPVVITLESEVEVSTLLELTMLADEKGYSEHNTLKLQRVMSNKANYPEASNIVKALANKLSFIVGAF